MIGLTHALMYGEVARWAREIWVVDCLEQWEDAIAAGAVKVNDKVVTSPQMVGAEDEVELMLGPLTALGWPQRLGPPLVVKVQRPLGGTAEPMLLLYDESRQMVLNVPVLSDAGEVLLDLFGEDQPAKVYADCYVVDQMLVVLGLSADQEPSW